MLLPLLLLPLLLLPLLLLHSCSCPHLLLNLALQNVTPVSETSLQSAGMLPLLAIACSAYAS